MGKDFARVTEIVIRAALEGVKRTGWVVAAQSEKKRSRLEQGDHVDVVQNLDGGVRSVLRGCRFEDGVQGQESGQRSLWGFCR